MRGITNQEKLRFVNIIIKTTFFGQRAEGRGAVKGIWKFFVVAVVMVGVAMAAAPPVAIADKAAEALIYQTNGGKCVFARMHRNRYIKNGSPLPIDLYETLGKCEEYRGVAEKERGRRKGKKLLGFFE